MIDWEEQSTLSLLERTKNVELNYGIRLMVYQSIDDNEMLTVIVHQSKLSWKVSFCKCNVRIQQSNRLIVLVVDYWMVSNYDLKIIKENFVKDFTCQFLKFWKRMLYFLDLMKQSKVTKKAIKAKFLCKCVYCNSF